MHVKEHYHADGDNTWSVSRLWELAKGLPIESAPIQEFKEWDYWVWEELHTLSDFMEHLLRIKGASDEPIIVSAEGWIMDGVHRLVKARLEGKQQIALVRFAETPPPD